MQFVMPTDLLVAFVTPFLSFEVHFLNSGKHFTVSGINFCYLHCGCSRAVGSGLCVCVWFQHRSVWGAPPVDHHLVVQNGILGFQFVFIFCFFVFLFQLTVFNFSSTFKVGAKNTSYL